ncbi:MAG: leucyl aminopeptidase [Rhodothermaceae bacterium]|nr:leucyl aminopeptidase [Rhodothermaceae bacterium]MXZ58662.1 leucyl aminopeptidase [Rhodothermaceae bacterium]MYB90976.1 leucyl aminopeptidase [Rhodothermaceae bacterium]MYD66975.1 leucyl aminopeptidase [Rhodothermaceae bacterium]MYG44771.1 leucyl aminopeptidase [Rhodothermaceae bacterium]
MKVSVTTLSLQDLDVDLLIIPVGRSLARARAAQIGGPVGEALNAALIDFEGDLKETLLCYPASGRARRVAVVGLGYPENIDREALRRAAAAGAHMAMKTKATTVALCLPDSQLDSEATGQSLVEGYMLASYEYDRYKTRPNEERTITERLVLHAGRDEKSARRGAERGRIEAEATITARDLINLSPHDKTPTLLGKIVERYGRKYGYEVSVWDKSDIEKEKMGGLLGVNRGSLEPPVMIEMTWKPSKAGNSRPVVLIGKGIVFDTGGLSLKPTKNSMDHMKADMAGAAAVIGAMEAIARLDVPLYVIGLIPATDNRPGQDAYVPGDVLRMHSGMTVEVLNTDAEGRLILADALSYAKLYRPEIVFDLATLTGAQVVALGSQVAAVMTREDSGASERLEPVMEAAERSGDLLHPMPMHAHYAEALKSDVADIKNIGNREAGSITAAKFLENFVDYPWVHIDMAGPSFLKSELPYRPTGGTGFGVRLLTEFIRDYAHPKKR